ncbi:MAG: 50S ribosomal protein L25 [Akkermansiaceae bacterium]|nr:50S ribosomal protein L25 [Akkermansiaceae bacterium]
MSTIHTLNAEPRKRTGSGVLNQMRREGYVPSVVYGGGAENQNVKVNEKAFKDLLRASASENILLNLELEGGGSQSAFLKDVQHHPLSGRVLHIDFLAIDQKTEITASLPVELHGEPAGAKEGGLLEQLMHSVEIVSLPKDLPDTIVIDVENLEIGDVLHIGEVAWPEGVKPTLGEDVVVALVAKARVVEEDVEGEEGAAAEGGAAEGGDEAATEEKSEG